MRIALIEAAQPDANARFTDGAGDVGHLTCHEVLNQDRQIGRLLDDQETELTRALHAAFQTTSNNAEQRATFQKLFAAVINDWVRGVIRAEGVETWAEFCARVNSGLDKFLSAATRGERVALFTSGGPIAVATQRALHLSPENTLQMTWMSRNSSWSEFLYSTDRFTLSSFNIHEHIADAAMLTYR